MRVIWVSQLEVKWGFDEAGGAKYKKMQVVNKIVTLEENNVFNNWKSSCKHKEICKRFGYQSYFREQIVVSR